jgi:hypothetical protein
MSDLSVTSGVNSTQQAQQSQWAQRKSLFDQLGKALQSGDLAGAQKAFTALQAISPQPPPSQDAQGNSTQSPFAALATALQSGDLAGAQQAFAQIQQTQGHHHHHHHASQSATTATSTTPTTTDITINGSGNTINLTA